MREKSGKRESGKAKTGCPRDEILFPAFPLFRFPLSHRDDLFLTAQLNRVIFPL